MTTATDPSLHSQYDCDQCGACCRTFPIFASHADAEREPLMSERSLPIVEWLRTEDRMYQLFPLPFLQQCCFLRDDQLCEIYETRPQVCRRFEAGSDQCQQARAHHGITPLAAMSIGEQGV